MDSSDPFGNPRRSQDLWQRTLVYFGLADGPDAAEPEAGLADPAVAERLDAIERRLAEQQRALDAIHELLRRDSAS